LRIPVGKVFGFLGPSQMVRDCVKALRAEGCTIFLITHNLPEAAVLRELIGMFR